MTATKNSGDARLENSCDMEYNVFVNIERASVAHDGGVVTASTAKGEIEFAAARERGEGHGVMMAKNASGARLEKSYGMECLVFLIIARTVSARGRMEFAATRRNAG